MQCSCRIYRLELCRSREWGPGKTLMRASSLDGVHNICSCLSPHRMQHERRNREGSPQSLTSVCWLVCAPGQGSGPQELTAARTMHTTACHLKIPAWIREEPLKSHPNGRSSWQTTAAGEGEAVFSSGIWALGGYPTPAAGPTSVHTQAAVNGLSGHWKQRTHPVWKETLWWGIKEENLAWIWSEHIMYMYKY